MWKQFSKSPRLSTLRECPRAVMWHSEEVWVKCEKSSRGIRAGCFKFSLESAAISTPQNTENPTSAGSVKETEFPRAVHSMAWLGGFHTAVLESSLEELLWAALLFRKTWAQCHPDTFTPPRCERTWVSGRRHTLLLTDSWAQRACPRGSRAVWGPADRTAALQTWRGHEALSNHGCWKSMRIWGTPFPF